MKVTSINREDLPADLAQWILDHQHEIANLLLVAELPGGSTVVKSSKASNLDVAWATIALFAVLSKHIHFEE